MAWLRFWRMSERVGNFLTRPNASGRLRPFQKGSELRKGASALASLRAKGRLQANPYEAVSKALSLSGFVILMAVGWIALCYIRSNLERHPNNPTRASEASMIQEPAQSQVQPAVSLVYSAASDKIYYHRPS